VRGMVPIEERVCQRGKADFIRGFVHGRRGSGGTVPTGRNRPEAAYPPCKYISRLFSRLEYDRTASLRVELPHQGSPGTVSPYSAAGECGPDQYLNFNCALTANRPSFALILLPPRNNENRCVRRFEQCSAENVIRGFLADHDGRRVEIAVGDSGHDG
jgi:hypothetical protein